MKIKRIYTNDRQIARLDYCQTLIYAYPQDDREWDINDLLDNLFLQASNNLYQYSKDSAVRKIRALLNMPIEAREECYSVALERQEEGRSDPIYPLPPYAEQIPNFWELIGSTDEQLKANRERN